MRIVVRRGRLSDAEQEFSVRKLNVVEQDMHLHESATSNEPELILPIEPTPEQALRVKVIGPIIAIYKQI